MKDFNFSSLHDPIGPLVIFLGRGFSRDFMLRINGNDMQATLGRLEMVWKQRVRDRPFNYHFLDDDYNKLYLAEQRSSELFSVAAGLAIILACSGLFGLAAFTTVQRTKEIGTIETSANKTQLRYGRSGMLISCHRKFGFVVCTCLRNNMNFQIYKF